MLKLRRLCYTIKGLDLLASLKKCDLIITKQVCIPHHFLYSIHGGGGDHSIGFLCITCSGGVFV